MTTDPSEKEWLERRSVRIWRRDTRDPQNFLGSGCLVSRTHVLTAAHVVNEVGDERLLVTGRAWASERTVREGPHYHQSAAARMSRRDVALLGLTGTMQTDEEPIALADDAFLASTQRQLVTIGGFAQPSGEDLKTVVTDVENYQDKTDSLVAASALESGMSGGPAVRNRKLVGVVYATSEKKHKTYIVPLGAIRAFLEEYVTTPQPVQSNASGARLTVKEAKKWVHYIDRRDQVADLAGFLGTVRAPAYSPASPSRSDAAPLIALLRCTERDRHRYLRRRFEDGEYSFDPYSDYANMLMGIEIHDVQFPPDDPEDLSATLYHMRERLRSSLGADSVEPSDIRRTLNERGGPQAVFSTIVAESGVITPKREQLLEKWIRFWEDVAGGTARGGPDLNHLLLVILSVVTSTATEQPSQSWFSRLFPWKKQPRSLQDWVHGWAERQSPAVRFGSFTKLGPIRQADVEAWLKALKKRDFQLAEAVAVALAEVPGNVPPEGITMARFVDDCLPGLVS